MKIDIYAFSGNGARLCDKLIEHLNDDEVNAYVPKRYTDSAKLVKLREENLYKSMDESFRSADCIIFVGSTGIAVRAIAPFVRSKKTDPAVICMDEKGINVISLLSGHIGGANRLTKKIADIAGGNPIITTATDINGKFAVDEWAHNSNLHIMSLKRARNIAADILEDKKIGFKSDFNVTGSIPDEIDFDEKETGICISLDSDKAPFKSTLNLIPRIVSVGVGCRKGTDFNDVYNAVKEVLRRNNISHFAISSINSIDLKKEEEAIKRTAEIFKVPFHTYSKDELNRAEGQFSSSDFVKSVAGVDTVCERAAIMGSKTKKMIINKTVVNSVTVAAAVDEYEVRF
ncbi:cobalt-precorrin 5A hydrolase [Sedimentibacter hydroxybenzoicus DSM 7310]|uniref:Cobalt-precorrin 5A hydrolase n=1 Tax=Sedimentibacter hydroxybenzoicus DSM 7310 TaxID=1123245 RepID=A0A974BL32_SEDHY|nr:cobalt-precorrin 5A hydrolase [Sedimentibacter hydroxybenzoicus]NYB75042.1 cobalt-precorrin 5A hydrolase [Sedimentibacter hydroxybenzoicus DSM 7310]